MLNWIIDLLLPAWFWNGVIVLGVATMIGSWAIKFLPGISIYRTPLAILGILLTVAGVYHLGAADNQERWEKERAILQAKINDFETRGPIIVREVETKYKKRIDTVAIKGDTVTKYIEQNAPAINKNCVVSKEAVKAHNAAALNQTIEANP